MSWTFTTLKSAIQDYTQNTESTFVADLAIIIQQGEDRIIKSVELPNFRKNVTGTFTSGNQYLATPSDYLYLIVARPRWPARETDIYRDIISMAAIGVA